MLYDFICTCSINVCRHWYIPDTVHPYIVSVVIYKCCTEFNNIGTHCYVYCSSTIWIARLSYGPICTVYPQHVNRSHYVQYTYIQAQNRDIIENYIQAWKPDQVQSMLWLEDPHKLSDFLTPTGHGLVANWPRTWRKSKPGDCTTRFLYNYRPLL